MLIVKKLTVNALKNGNINSYIALKFFSISAPIPNKTSKFM